MKLREALPVTRKFTSPKIGSLFVTAQQRCQPQMWLVNDPRNYEFIVYSKKPCLLLITQMKHTSVPYLHYIFIFEDPLPLKLISLIERPS